MNWCHILPETFLGCSTVTLDTRRKVQNIHYFENVENTVLPFTTVVYEGIIQIIFQFLKIAYFLHKNNDIKFRINGNYPLKQVYKRIFADFTAALF